MQDRHVKIIFKCLKSFSLLCWVKQRQFPAWVHVCNHNYFVRDVSQVSIWARFGPMVLGSPGMKLSLVDPALQRDTHEINPTVSKIVSFSKIDEISTRKYIHWCYVNQIYWHWIELIFNFVLFLRNICILYTVCFYGHIDFSKFWYLLYLRNIYTFSLK